MKLPAGYGQVIKLGGRRRRPYAVRVTDGEKKMPDGSYTPKIKYLEYFDNRRDALDYLAKYNAGIVIEKRPTIISMPTFAEVYQGFMKFYESRNKDASKSAFDSYRTAFKNASDLHGMKFVNIRTEHMQDVISTHSGKSKSTVNNLIKLFHGMYKHAMRTDLVKKDYSAYVYVECTEAEKPAHTPFTESEINVLWDAGVPAPIIMVYTGLRCTEFLTIENENVDLDRHIMRGGIKTKAGKNRIIPIHDAILPLVADMKSKGKYLFGGDESVTAACFRSGVWNKAMLSCGLETHVPHDTRHTAATLMEKYEVPLYHRKLILGHSVQDLTEGVYTHVDPTALVDDINRIPARFA